MGEASGERTGHPLCKCAFLVLLQRARRAEAAKVLSACGSSKIGSVLYRLPSKAEQ